MSRRQNDAANTPVDDHVRPDKLAPPSLAAEMYRSGTVQRPPASKQPHSRARTPVAVTLPGNATPSRPDDLPSLGDSDRRASASGGNNLKDLTGAAPPRSSSDSTPSRVRRAASQLPTVVDEGYEEGPPAPSCSGPRVAPSLGDNGGQNMENPAAVPVAKKTSKLSWFRSTTTTTDTMPGTATLRHKPSFRDRFWSASSSNDFGDSAKSSGSSPIPASASAPPKRAPYVPRHAASDFARTTNSRPLQHRQSSSWDGGNNYTLRPPPPPIDEESPFADSHETSTLYDTSSPPPQRLSSPPAPLQGRDSITEADERLSSDYEHFLANAAAEERAQRAQAARRSWRNGGEGSRHDSAYYSAGGRRGGSARTSEDGSGASLGHIPRTSPEAIMEAKRQSRAAQKIVEYIKPPREDMRGSVRVE
ncbi:hypothetical protein F5X68DRAFT_189441 [Plectosphaerella plurivora]|uniref:Uncharacterized protein n=1 Tax=Plectosphaerella plurivora TaxID=936078 RepID=A0A9P8VF27_9PEZI|nr:hypothetical protein F5X68DRAFT_189441 [Plectosphaerella plurivora]